MQQGKTARTQRINNAIHTLPRDQFVEMKDPNLVLGRSIPPTQAVLDILRHADIEPRHNVLQVGTGAGYLSALLSKLASQVVTIEINPAIARWAQGRFNKLELANLVLRTGDGSLGAPDLGPFDRILVSSPRVGNKDKLLQQLTPDGFLLALEESDTATHILARYIISELGAKCARKWRWSTFPGTRV